MTRNITVAAAHSAPVFLDKQATLEKAIAAIQEAAKGGAQLIAFPESFLPGFPVWAAVRAPIYNHKLFTEMVKNSIYADGPEVEQLMQAAKTNGIHVSFGFSELSRASVGCIWNSNVLIGSDGVILNHHRKIMPTFYEKLVWAPGDGDGLRVTDTEIGRIGTLICGENTNPLARFALIAEREELHISTYPPLWPTQDPSMGLDYDLESAIRIWAGAHSFEGKVFNLVVSSIYDSTAKTKLSCLGSDAEDILEGTARGVSFVMGPHGNVVSEVMRKEEGLLFCTIDLDECIEQKQFQDISGYYNRFDIFDLRVHRERMVPAKFFDGSSSKNQPPSHSGGSTDLKPKASKISSAEEEN
ncbi:carbon-nitrogen hydrolase family protein [Paenibacillus sp. BJ-4]|uniref:carbon-nitrogen hydrolase family protein n=1 Tax=Paenibacillus sp. BJ-4 TaxID=2878097 RepID=UPI001CF0B686|nr:carbon-nitrogen hydrolase family protein [Paenibacillus sp. BJ-4]